MQKNLGHVMCENTVCSVFTHVAGVGMCDSEFKASYSSIYYSPVKLEKTLVRLGI